MFGIARQLWLLVLPISKQFSQSSYCLKTIGRGRAVALVGSTVGAKGFRIGKGLAEAKLQWAQLPRSKAHNNLPAMRTHHIDDPLNAP